MKRLTFILAILTFSTSIFTQENANILTYDSYIKQVMENHPSVFRASIVQSSGESLFMQSQGAFDPQLIGNINQKYFNDKKYYSHIHGGLQVPTWFGIKGEAGYRLNEGVYLNPENRTPIDGLWYAGLRLELGNGLIIDQRRAEYKKAKLYRTSSELERRILLNQLHLDATIAYRKWQQAYSELSIYKLAKENADLRFEAVKITSSFGDRPYIDTVEASITVQNRQLSLLKAQTNFENAEINLEIYLWSDGFVPLELENTIPSNDLEIFESATLVKLDSLIANHPYLRINTLELEQKKIDLQLKKEQLKPQLTLKYNAISEPMNGNPLSNYSMENYNWGATFSYPILSRNERGGVQLAKLNLEDQQLKNSLNAVEVDYKVKTSMNSFLLSVNQLTIIEQLVENNFKMYDAEKKLFDLGESSVFMINTRENSWLNSQIQFITSKALSQILWAELEYQVMVYE